MEPEIPQPCTNWYGTRRHYSINLEYYDRGRRGDSLCSSIGNPVEVWDQRAVDSLWGNGRKVIADLPECKRCARLIAKMGADSGG